MSKIKIVVILLFVMFMTKTGFLSMAAPEMPDFDYPQQVSAQAKNDLKKALRNGDGQLVVDALVRYSIAKSSVTDESMDTIVREIEAVRLKEKRPDVYALLSYFEALVFRGYSMNHWRNNHENAPDEPNPADYTEWSQEQFGQRVNQLLDAAMSNPEALKQCPIGNYSKIINCKGKLGTVYCPNLLVFLASQCRQVGDNEYLKSRFWKYQLQGADVSEEATIYNTNQYLFDTYASSSEKIALYEKYKHNEHSGLILDALGSSKDYYDINREYVKLHPNGLYAYDVRSNIASVEEKEATASYSGRYHSTDTIKVSGRVNNVNDLTLTLYRVPDTAFYRKSKVENWIDVSALIPVATQKVRIEGTIPFRDTYKAEFPPQTYGKYIVLTSYDVEGKQHGVVRTQISESFLVTDIVSFTTGSSGKDEPLPDNRIIVVDTKTGAPQQGVKIEFKDKDGLTGRDGVYTYEKNVIIRNSLPYYISRGEDKYVPKDYLSGFSIDADRPVTTAETFTDLAIYRPGETVKFAAIVYRNGLDIRTVVPQEKVKVVFNDPNWQEIESLELETDEFGRVEGEFKIPTDRMNASFSISLYHGNKYNTRLDNHYITVSEYKAPTFMVSLDETRTSFTKDQPVIISGKVETYSGMPVSNANVQLRVSQNEWSWDWRWHGKRNGTVLVDTVAVTDADGKFTLNLPPDTFAENKERTTYYYSRYSYDVNAMCTNVAGETQEGSHVFIIGGRRGIKFATHSDIAVNNVKPYKLPLSFNSTDPDEKSVKCYYKVEDKDKNTVLTGNFDSDNPTIDFTSLPSGNYKVSVNILTEAETDESKDYCYIILYRLTDKQPPVENNPMWMPEDSRRVDDKNVAHIPIGVSVDVAHIYYIAYSRDAIVAQGWLDYKRGFHDLALQIPQLPEEYVDVTLLSVYDGSNYEEHVKLYSNIKKKLKIKVETFRDKLVPGEHESWTFRLVNVDDTPYYGAMLLEMIDKAINDIEQNTWRFHVGRYSVSRASMSSPWHPYYSSTSYTHRQRVNGDSPDVSWPEFNMYGENLFGDYEYLNALGGMVVYEMASGRPEPMMAKRQSNRAISMDDDTDTYIEAEEAEVDEAALENVAIRESDVKVAVWQPLLKTDKDGRIVVEFDAPQNSTTWVMQAIAYNADLYIGSETRNVLTQKPIMVKSSVPRFLRQGDKVSLAATLQNATDEKQAVDAVIELFNPRTGEVVSRKTFNENLAERGTNALTIEWAVPDTLDFIGFRVKAANKVYGDGEQVMIPVLQNISPVIESTPFYIDAQTPNFSVILPQFPLDSRVTLEYCDNPTWYCVTALPTIYNSNNDVATSLAHSLYAVSIANGVANANPQIREAVNHWVENNATDSTLVSMLQKNGDLKIGNLLASPWLREADRQSLRMSRLNELMDPNYVESEIERIVNRLCELQMSDGGWPWFRFPGCESSLYTTQYVLEIIGEIQHLGFLSNNRQVDEMVKRALNYYDKKELQLFKEQQKLNKNNNSGFSDYVYVRTLFPSVPLGSENQAMIKKCLKAMKKDWKGTSIGNKAFYAMTLNRNGETKVAKSIVESIRQFAMVKPELGMYWDNLNRGWNYYDDKVAVTSVVLQAMNEVDPRPAELDLIRKWMLLMKQTNDWGSSSLAADAIYSILSTGNSKWLSRNATPSITINGEPVEVDRRDAYLGYFRREIPATSGATLAINRSGDSPAWGAVYSQYHAPMTEIAQVEIDDISIRKEFHVYNSDGTLKPADKDFKVGDKVQVRVVIKNNKDLDFVTIKDERGACFEPKDKTSGYRYADGDYYYLEIKDSETNLFFNSLGKGTHVISYDAYITAEGEYSVGIATVQCQYAPQVTAHSAGSMITVK